VLYFAGQGRASDMAGPWRDRTVVHRAAIRWVVVADFGGGLQELFIAVAAGSIAFGAQLSRERSNPRWARLADFTIVTRPADRRHQQLTKKGPPTMNNERRNFRFW